VDVVGAVVVVVVFGDVVVLVDTFSNKIDTLLTKIILVHLQHLSEQCVLAICSLFKLLLSPPSYCHVN